MPRINHSAKALCFSTLLTLAFAGCSSTNRAATGDAMHQFSPVPRATVATEDLEPVENRSVTELLHKAEESYRQANEAQERGDKKAALQHYTAMMEMLLDADLDPGIYYDLRKEFGSIIDKSHKHARVTDRQRRMASGKTFTGAGGIQVPQPLPQRVLDEIDRIENVYPKNFQYGLNQSARYMDYLKAELKKAGLPEELVWVAMIESHFTPKIVSRAGAGGMWQFMRPTGQRYGLRIDSYVDERYDWQRSTTAAIEYLKFLYTTFDGDWALAVSAYNMGEGGLGRAIEAGGGERDLWTLLDTPPASDRIQEETKRYYAKFLASIIVGSDPEAYGFTVPKSSMEATVRVPVNGMYALGDLNAAMGLAPGTLARLNPELVREATPPSGSHALAVPAEAQAKLADALKVVAQKRETVASHKVRKGETIAQLAKKYGVGQDELMRLNKIRSAKSLKVGQTLKLPNGAQGSTQNFAETEPAVMANAASSERQAAKESTSGPSKTYKVRTGDTLYDIAKAHDVSIDELRAWNGLDKKNTILGGQRLKVSAGSTAASQDSPAAKDSETAAPAATIHVVRAGEYPAKIAQAYGMSTKDFLALNKMKSDATIAVGDKVKVASAKGSAPVEDAPVKTAAKSKAADAEVYHKVAPGDTAFQIAQQYGVSLDKFLEWNGLNPKSVLKPGDTHVVHVNGARVKHAAGEAESPAPESASDGAREMHVVAKGQNPSSIARRYGVKVSDLYRWNNWPAQHVLRVGDTVVYFK
jgi:membrane-bound lytic murein transglycosylase D